MRARHRSAVGDRERVEQGYAGRISGEIDLDTSAGKVRRFRAFSDGKAFGEGTFTPYPPPGRFHLLVGMVEAAEDDRIAHTVPPEGVATHASDSLYHEAALPLLQKAASPLLRATASRP